LGDQVQVRPELIRSNQVVNLMRGLWRRENEIEIKSKFVRLCVDVSTWSMVAILELRRIRVKGRLLGIVTRICRDGR